MRLTPLFCLLCISALSPAMAGGIFKQSAEVDFDVAYKKVYTALEENRFFVIDEIDMATSLARFKDKWDDFNMNKLEQQKIMIICNGWYANQVGNADTDMLALCPMRVTLLHKDGMTTVLFAKPSTFAANSKAMPILTEIETTITGAINRALN